MATRTLRSTSPSIAASEEPAPAAVSTPTGMFPDDEPAGTVGGPLTGVVTTTTSDSAISVPRSLPVDDGSGVSGDWGENDIKLPALKIVAGSGKASALFGAGTLILGDDPLLSPPDLRNPKANEIITFVPVSMVKNWRESLTQEEVAQGLMPRVVDTVAEVEALGGTTTWVNDVKPTWGPSGRIVLLIQQPDVKPGNEHPMFTFELDGKMWATAVYYAANTAFNHTAKVLYNAVMTSLRIPVLDEEGKPKLSPAGVIMKRPYLARNLWTMRVTKRTVGTFSVWGPEIRMLTTETSPAVRAQADMFTAS